MQNLFLNEYKREMKKKKKQWTANFSDRRQMSLTHDSTHARGHQINFTAELCSFMLHLFRGYILFVTIHDSVVTIHWYTASHGIKKTSATAATKPRIYILERRVAQQKRIPKAFSIFMLCDYLLSTQANGPTTSPRTQSKPIINLTKQTATR